MNTAPDVYDALNGYLNGGTIDLYAAATGSDILSDMVPMLGLFGITATYSLTSGNLALSGDRKKVTLTGEGTYAEPLTGANSVAITGTLIFTEGDQLFTLSLQVRDDWTFENFFQNLPDTLMQDPREQQGIIWYESILKKFTIRGLLFIGTSEPETSLRMQGWLLEPNDDYILSKTPMIFPWPLTMSGTVDVNYTEERNFPLLDLEAKGSNTSFTADSVQDIDGPSPITLDSPGLNLISAPLEPAQGDRVGFSTLELYGDFAFGAITGRISTLILSTGNLWNFTVRFTPGTATLAQGIAEIANLFGIPSEDLPIPMNFPLISDFYIAAIDIDLDAAYSEGQRDGVLYVGMPSFSINGLGITLASDKVWNPPIPFVTLRNVGIRWVWGWSTVNTELGGQETIYTMNGSVFGILDLGSSGAAALPPPSSTPPDDGAGAGVEDPQPVSIAVSMLIPQFIIRGSLPLDSYIPISDILNFYFASDTPPSETQVMNIVRLNFSADPFAQRYSADASILFGDPENPDDIQGWEINLVVTTITLNQLDFFVNLNSGKLSGGINAVLYLNDAARADPTNYDLPKLLIGAEYPAQNPEAPQGWTLRGYLYPGTSIDLVALVTKFIYGHNGTAPDWVDDLGLTIDRLAAEFTTGSANVNTSYTFGGTISGRWTPTIFGTQLKINASASTDIARAADEDSPSGSVSGSFSVNKFLIEAGLTFGVPDPTYQFKVQFDQLWLQASTSWRGEGEKRHQVVSLQLGGVTLGDILEYFVNLAAPTLGYTLDSPWDILKQIELSSFVLTIDPSDNTVELVYHTDVNLVVANLDSIGVRYTSKTGQGKVELILTGNFLGEEYPPDKPLGWDVVNDDPPEVPGKGISLIDLRYLGLGQRVTFNGDVPDTVAGSLNLLRQQMQPPGEGNPLDGQGLRYSSDSQWLIGADITLLDTISLGFIFNDPVLYGLSLGLSGKLAGALSGLKFEILYKKITDDIGMFRVEFQVPDLFRTIQLGAVTLTLGIIVVEIYTNGNFKVDLGFPYDRNFERSFSLQAGIFIGRGGFYLGVLNGDTSTQVPAITNGNFSPVIELGIGIAAGIGREVREGILAGGAYIELEVIFQGVLAFFHPSSQGQEEATFFRAQGIAALHGKVYGEVDFKVIKVSVTLEAYAQVSITYESYQPMLIELEVDVNARASVKILFVKVHFSFHVNLQFSFTVGTAQATPWILADNGSGNNLNAKRQSLSKKRGITTLALEANPEPSLQRSTSRLRVNKHRRMLALRNHHRARIAKRGLVMTSANLPSPEYDLVWNPSQKVFADAPRPAHMTLLPTFTLGDVPIRWNDTQPDNLNPTYRAAFVLFADTGMQAEAKEVHELAARDAAHSGMAEADDATHRLAADILVEGLTRYAVDSLQINADQEGTITSGQLQHLLDALRMEQTMDTGFSQDSLATFFATNIAWWISGEPSTGPEPNEKGAMVVPMPPFLHWTSDQVPDIDFGTYHEIGPLYEWGIAQLLGVYNPTSTNPSERPTNDDPAKYESFASFLFRDFCLMLVENALTEMQKHMNDTDVVVTQQGENTPTLAEIARTLPTATVPYVIQSGDTVESVAEHLGATVEELEFLNNRLANDLESKDVGTSITVTLGVPPQVLALDNPSVAFGLTQVTLGTLVHQASQGETLEAIATLFQTTVVALLQFTNSNFPILTALSQTLQQGSTFDLPAQTYTDAPADFTQARTAGVFFVRYQAIRAFAGTAVEAPANWYVQVIAEMNADILGQMLADEHIPSDLELPPGRSLKVPNQFQVAYNDPSNAGEFINYNAYTTVPGDTLNRIGQALVLSQDFATTTPEGVPGWAAFRDAVTVDGDSRTIPAQTGITVRPSENIRTLVRRMVVNATWTGSDTAPFSAAKWSYSWTAVADWIGAANILAPVASVTVPDAQTATHDTLNFEVISQVYGMPVLDAASALADTAGLYPDGTILTVKLLPAQELTVLFEDILGTESFAAIVNQSSRMLMSGLQLPDLKDEDGHTVPNLDAPLPLYDLSGQQMTVPVDATQPDETALALSLFGDASWIQLFDSITVSATDTYAQLLETYPDLLTYNPGLTEDNLTPGMILLTSPVDTSLNYAFTNQQVQNHSPATGLTVVPIPPTPPAPTRLPLKGTTPLTHGLEHQIPIQTPVPLPIPQVPGQTNVSGNPSVWKFPTDILNRARAENGTPYTLKATQRGAKAGAAAQTLVNTTYGMLLPFKVRQLTVGTGRFELVGVDTDMRGLLLSLRNWLMVNPVSGNAPYMLVAPAPNATNTTGLTLLSGTAEDTYLVKTNLSTDSVAPGLDVRPVGAEENESEYYASLASLTNFITLLWEGSVVGGTGYFFGTGQALPASAIDNQGLITMELLLIAGNQQSTPTGGRSLLPFNNCALVGPGIDSSQVTVYMEAADQSELTTQALVPPGNTGFQLLTHDPDKLPQGTLSATEQSLQDLFSLLTFKVDAAPGSPFAAPTSGMPVLPAPSDGTQMMPWERELQAEAEEELYRSYVQVLPVSRFVTEGTPEAAPAVTGLPDPVADPYRGYGALATLPEAHFVFGFGDVLGNRTAENPAGEGATIIPVGYTDPLIGLSEWPSASSYFEVKPDQSQGNDASLHTFILYRASELVPTPAQPGNALQDMVVQQRDKYRQIFYQYIQPGLEGWMVTSLKLVTDPEGNFSNKGLPLSSLAPLWKFSGGAYAYTRSLLLMEPGRPLAVTAPITLSKVIDTYSLRWTELATANAAQTLENLFGDLQAPPADGNPAFGVPAYLPAVENQTLGAMLANLPSGWPTTATPTSIIADPENDSLPLRVGTLWMRPAQSVNTGTDAPTPALKTLAEGLYTSVNQLALDNASESILSPGFEFAVEAAGDVEIVITVAADTLDSFNAVVLAFEGQGIHVTVQMLATDHAGDEGMFAPNQTLNSLYYQTQNGDTLASNHSETSIADLASLNDTVPNLFDPGALVYLGEFDGIMYEDQAEVTLSEFATRYACPVPLLLQHNEAVVLPDTTSLLLPGAWQWPTDTTNIRIPYTIGSADTLTQVGEKFAPMADSGTLAEQLVEANLNMPGTLSPNHPITVTVAADNSRVSITTEPNQPSFQSALDQVQAENPAATLADLISAIQDDSTALQAGGLLLCGPAKLSSDLAPNQITEVYNVLPQVFAMANAAIPDLVKAGATLTATNAEGLEVSEVTKEHDTLNTLLTRFADQGLTLSVGALFQQNEAVAFLQGGSTALLPPKTIDFSDSLGQGGPYSKVISPLTVNLRFLRPAGLIDPEFATGKYTSPVEAVESTIAAPSRNDDDNTGLTFNAFVTELEQALPDLRIGTGQVAGTPNDLWTIDFSSAGIKEVALDGGLQINHQAQPRFFALTPLYPYLVTRANVPIKALNPDGTLREEEIKSFQSIDVELWARKFVEDFDRFLTGTYATALYEDSQLRPSLDGVLDTKTNLLSQIAAGLDKVLSINTSGDDAAKVSAQQALEQQLGVSLAKTYESTVMIQYNSTADTGTHHLAANLVGDATIQGDPDQRCKPDFPAQVNGVAIESAKTPLSIDNGHVNFLTTVENPARHRQIKGIFNYAYSNLEFNISEAGVPDDFTASDWLTLVPLQTENKKPAALSGTNPGCITVPIPLRIFPELPIIAGQTAKQGYGNGQADLASLSLWQYHFTYSHQHAEQDYVNILAQFNLVKPAQDAAAANQRDLFTELAQYVSVAPQLWDILNGLVDPTVTVPAETLQNAVATYATLVENIDAKWSTRHTAQDIQDNLQDDLTTDQNFRFEARVTYGDNENNLISYHLIRLNDSPGPDGHWPQVWIKGPLGNFIEMVKGEENGTSVTYTAPNPVGIPSPGWPTVKIVWDQLNIGRIQNARAKLWVERNQDLISGTSTNPRFLFATDVVVAPSVVTPLNTYGYRVDITNEGNSLADAINHSLATLFGDDLTHQKVTMELSYGYELVASASQGDEGLVTYLPIGLYPNQQLSADTGQILSGYMDAWQEQNHPEEQGGEWVFSLRLYSYLTQNPQVLLSIDYIVYKLGGKDNEQAE